MKTTQPYSQKILDRINKWFAQPQGQGQELEHALSTVREDNRALRQELQTVNSRLESGGHREEQRLAEVQQRMECFESERDMARLQLQEIHAALSDASHRQDALDDRLENLTGTLNEQLTIHQAEIRKAQTRMHEHTDLVVQLQTSMSQTVHRQDQADGRLLVLTRKLEEQQSSHQLEIQEARLRDRMQVRRLNIAMMLAGCAFLVTTVASAVWIKDARENAQLLSDVSRNIRDLKLSVESQLSESTHEPPEEVSTALLDGTPSTGVGVMHEQGSLPFENN